MGNSKTDLYLETKRTGTFTRRQLTDLTDFLIMPYVYLEVIVRAKFRVIYSLLCTYG